MQGIGIIVILVVIAVVGIYATLPSPGPGPTTTTSAGKGKFVIDWWYESSGHYPQSADQAAVYKAQTGKNWTHYGQFARSRLAKLQDEQRRRDDASICLRLVSRLLGS